MTRGPRRKPAPGRRQTLRTQARLRQEQQMNEAAEPSAHSEHGDSEHGDIDSDVDNGSDIRMAGLDTGGGELERVAAGDQTRQTEDDVQMLDVDDLWEMFASGAGGDGEDGGDARQSTVPPSLEGSESESDEDDLVDVDDIRAGNIEDIAAQAGIPLDEVIGVGDYEDAFFVPIEEFEPFDELNPDMTGQEEVIQEEGPVPIYPPDEDDISTFLGTRQNKSVQLSTTEKALATYADLTGLSRRDYDALREVFMTIRDDNGNIPSVVLALPKQLSTLTRKMRSRMPMMNMREAKIPLNVMKMPTLPAGVKGDERRKIEALRARHELDKAIRTAKRAENRAAKYKGDDIVEGQALEKAAERANARVEKLKRIADAQPEDRDLEPDAETAQLPLPLPTSTATLTFFDPPTVFRNMVMSDIGKRAHSGPGHFVDMPKELFESHAWLSSVRTTSGRFAHVILDLEGDVKGPPIFPGDWICYRCTKEAGTCPLSCNEIPDDEMSRKAHLGRVYGVGLDRRKKRCTDLEDQMCLQIQEAFRQGSPATAAALDGVALTPAHDHRELILTSALTYIPETKVYAQLDVYIDRYFGEGHNDPGAVPTRPHLGQRAKQKTPAPFPKYTTPVFMESWDKEHMYYMVRRMVNKARQVIPMCHTHPLRAELELEEWGREEFCDEWDKDREDTSNIRVISFPHLNFIDGFGVYRNSYRTLMGFYFTPAGLSAKERARPGSIFPLLLGPHGSNFTDITKALKTMTQLDKGMVIEIYGENGPEQVRLCAFPLCYIGDMPQQAENCGFKGPRAIKFCRCCFTFSTKRGPVGASGERDPDAQINFDIITHGRFHYQIMEMQQSMAAKGTGDAKHYGRQWGLKDPHPALTLLSPALDIVMSRAPDPGHSEYNGIINLVHFLFRDQILNSAGRTQYAIRLQSWPFPPGWQKLHSPIKHLASYSMSEHAKWMIIVPAMLLHWLHRDYMRERFCRKAEAEGLDPVDIVVETMATLARSTTLLMGYNASNRDRREFDTILYRARHLFNQLHVLASKSISNGSRTSSMSASVSGTGNASPVDTPGTPILPDVDLDADPEAAAAADAGNVEAIDKRTNKKQSYIKDIYRPNVHIAMHYADFAEEYGLPANLNTLTGENLHRWFKEHVYQTNYSNIEKILLMKSNFEETVRLILQNAFVHDDEELTREMMELRQQCPTLFDRVLSREDRNDIKERERQEFEPQEILPGNQRHSGSASRVGADHLSPRGINRIPPKQVVAIHAVNEGKRLPRRTTFEQTSALWQRLLARAHQNEYGAPSTYSPSTLENKAYQWCHKMAFTDRTSNDRYIFQSGDYIQYLSRSSNKRFGRIDHIFMHDITQNNQINRFIFAIITRVKRTKQRHPLLDLEILEEDEDADPIIIGLNAMLPVSLYIVRVAGVGLVWVDWDVHTL